MSLYAIGDVQGCLSCLRQLLETIEFDPLNDQLWFAGDLVNRGPDSLGTLRFIKSLGSSAICVLGNHDLHLIAAAYGINKLRARDTLQPILDASDRIELVEWLRNQPLFHVKQRYCLVHAGLPPQWSVSDASHYAHEVEAAIRGEQIKEFLGNMYGNDPTTWDNNLSGWERLRFITNALTRIRYCHSDGSLQMIAKHSPLSNTEQIIPWYAIEKRHSQSAMIIFGHWSALGLKVNDEIISLDTGCVWGGCLTAVQLGSDHKIFQVRCNQSS